MSFYLGKLLLKNIGRKIQKIFNIWFNFFCHGLKHHTSCSKSISIFADFFPIRFAPKMSIKSYARTPCRPLTKFSNFSILKKSNSSNQTTTDIFTTHFK